MGGASSHFLALLNMNNARDTSTADKNIFKYFMQELRKYMKKKRPYMLTKEVTVLGKIMWKDFDARQKQIFYEDLCKRERQREDRKKRSGKFSALTTLFSQPILRRRNSSVIVQDSWNIANQRTQFVPTSTFFYSRRTCERSQSNGIKKDSFNLDHQAGPSTSRSNASCVVPRRRYKNSIKTKSKRSIHKVRTNKRKRRSYHPSALQRRNPTMYRILNSTVKLFFKINNDAQNTKSRCGFMWRKTKRRPIAQKVQQKFKRRSTRLMQQKSPVENNNGDSCSKDRYNVLTVLHTPQSRNTSPEQQSLPNNEAEDNDDDSYSEQSDLGSGGTSSTQLSIE